MSTIEFLIRGTQLNATGAVVSGVVNQGVVKRGTKFLCSRMDESKYDIDFTVDKIITYHREVEILHEGMSGDLYLVGIEANHFGKGAMLSTYSAIAG